MEYLISGGTGFIGSRLIQRLPENSKIYVLTRSQSRVENNINYIHWDGITSNGWANLITKDTIIINLAGESISKRWTKKRQERIVESRVNAGKAFVEAIEKENIKPKAFFQASAVGYYGWHIDPILTEKNPATKADFLSKVCVQWEESTKKLDEMGIRRIIGRIGVVLDKKYGAFPRFVLPIKLLLGGSYGRGYQWISWIHIKDLINAILFLLNDEKHKGVYNLCAPNPVSNNNFGYILAKELHRPYFLNYPSFLLKLFLGKMADAILAGQRVFPQRLIDEGFEFQFPYLRMAVKDLLNKQSE